MQAKLKGVWVSFQRYGVSDALEQGTEYVRRPFIMLNYKVAATRKYFRLGMLKKLNCR